MMALGKENAAKYVLIAHIPGRAQRPVLCFNPFRVVLNPRIA